MTGPAGEEARRAGGSGCGTLRRADHACLPFATAWERLSCIAAFLREGLDEGEHGVYLTGETDRAEVERALEAVGLPVREASDQGRLAVLDGRAHYLEGGRFDPLRMLDWIGERSDRAVREGARGLRLVGESACFPPGVPGTERLSEYETMIDGFIASRPVSVLCAYDRSRVPPSVVRDALSTHALVVVDGRVRRNPLHVDPSLAPHARSNQEVERLVDVLRGSPPAHDEPLDGGGGTRAVLEALEADRAAVARDLHDGLGEVLAAAHLALQRAIATGATAAAADGVLEGDALVARAMEHVRALALDLRPPALDDLGLAAAVRSCAVRAARAGDLDVEVEVPGLDGVEIPPATATACFRVVQEAVRNAVSHAAATRVRVAVVPRSGGLDVLVEDDGRGFDAPARREPVPSRGLGLVGMAERCAMAGGRLVVESAPERGTTVRARFPL